MKRRSHYAILGIGKGESPQGIRAAYLRLAKELHPDHAGASSAQAFREIQRAYAVLSDPETRRRYDSQHDAKRPSRSWGAEPVRQHPGAEPLAGDPASVARGRRASTGVIEELTCDGVEELTHIGAEPSRPRRQLCHLEVVMSPAHAARGGSFTIRVPLRRRCPACAGTGGDWIVPCWSCGQRGWVVREHELHLHLPPHTRSGTVVQVALQEPGGAALRIRLLVDTTLRAPPAW